MNTVFGTAPIDVGAWLRIFGIAIAASIVVALDKWLRRPRPSSSVPALHKVAVAHG